MIRYRAAQRRRAGPRRQMAVDARRGIQRVVVGDVAGNAGRGRRGNVHARQRKAGGAVIKRRRRKTHGRVAIRAVGHGK